MAIKVERVVFLSLLLDLFAFTIPLPLFPRIIEWYTVVSRDVLVEAGEPLNSMQRESAYSDGLLARTLRLVSGTRNLLLRTPAKNPQKWDIVLLGVSGVEIADDTSLNDSFRRIHGINLFVSSTAFSICTLSDGTTARYSSSSHLTSARCLTSTAGNASSSSRCWATYSPQWSGFSQRHLPLTCCQE